MQGEILRIKTHIPPLGKNIVQRNDILIGLEENLFYEDDFLRKVTLLSAPAGFGKTTLVQNWIREKHYKWSWYSIDINDNCIETFWVYFIYALETHVPELGKGTLEILRSSTNPEEFSSNPSILLTSLLNDLLGLKEKHILVLDDFHLINSKHIHHGMEFLIENLPPKLHIIITTRSDPPWPLARWRTKGSLKEIRLGDLKFDLEKSREFFSTVKNIHLTEEQYFALYNRTEGWAAGLCLAAFSISMAKDLNHFVKELTGSARHLANFLNDEVFLALSEELRDFLLSTSPLKMFCASLCDEITGKDNSKKLIEELERKNLFLIPLDEEGIWYRYHHLFAGFLLHNLNKNEPEVAKKIHERAAKWFFKEEEPVQAMVHAIESNDIEQIGKIFHRYYNEIIQTYGPNLLIQSVENFPPEALKSNPVLAAHNGFYLLIRKGISQSREYLDIAHKFNDESKNSDNEFKGILNAIECYYNIYNNDMNKAVLHAKKALELLPEKNHYWRMCISVFYGDTKLFSGNPQSAYKHYNNAHTSIINLGNEYFMLSTGFKVATSLYYLGRLKEAKELVEKLLKISDVKSFNNLVIVGALKVLSAEFLRQEGKLHDCRELMDKGLEIAFPEKPPYTWSLLYKITLMFSLNEYQAALQIISEIEEIHENYSLPFFVISSVFTWKALILFKTGYLDQAKEILDSLGISENQPIKQGLERGYLLLACIFCHGVRHNGRVKIHDAEVLDKLPESEFIENTLLKCRKMVNDLEKNSLSGNDFRIKISLSIFKGLILYLSGDMEKAKEIVSKAVTESQNAGYIQLIEDLKQTFDLPDIILEGEVKDKKNKFQNGQTEELSDREKEILTLISKGFTNKEIAEKLFLSIGTVKWHTSNIYSKLGVKSRTKALDLANRMEIIE